MRGKSAARPKPVKPRGLETPGMIYRHRPSQDAWHLMWSPTSALVERGYPKTTYRLWPPSGVIPPPLEPTPEEWEGIAAWCERYQAEMRQWANGGVTDDPRSVFDGTISSLIKLYQTDPDSDFNKIRHVSQTQYTRQLRTLDTLVGSRRVDALTFRDFLRWYEQFAAPELPGEPERRSGANGYMTRLRDVFKFGKLALPKSSGCAAVCEILSEMEFSAGNRRRTEYMTAEYCRLIRTEARRRGLHSIALAQAFQFELGVRQGDMLGHWVPRAWPGVSDIFSGGHKWLMGARWEEIDADLIWTHRLSKSVKGKKAVMQAEVGKTEQFDLKVPPMVMEELSRIYKNNPSQSQNVTISRADFPASGPMLINERTGRPWHRGRFNVEWRKIARACGIPDEVQNRDSRAGASTEARLAGVPRDDRRQMLGHSRAETTDIYDRAALDVRRNIAHMRAETRK
jgi:hypothetical protein